ncbi:MAG TPA: hypothetical protein PKC89_02450 [Pyrinomonadaceae bacterium]|nr:hypothetical protein [Pyrinomonadaceae bacterium]
MKKIILLAVITTVFVTAAFAQHQPFTLVSSAAKTITFDELVAAEKTRDLGVKGEGTLTFSKNEIRLVIATGPESDMLSYRIQGMRNPTLIVPEGARLKILIVNKDSDMWHDLRIGHVMGEFAADPTVAMTAGSVKLEPAGSGKTWHAQELVIQANEAGSFKYFCSVTGHAKGGMWGTINVGAATEKMPAAESMPAGHDHHKMMGNNKTTSAPTPTPTPSAEQDHSGHNMPGTDGGKHGDMQMSSTVNIGDPMSRESSGTAWVPDSTPMYAYMKHFKDGGMFMLMGSAFVRYTAIGSSRDVSVAGKGSRSRFDAPHMLMAMYSRPAGKNGQIGIRTMFSLDALTQRGYGYPLLYQSGEQFHGQPVHDRQHPHDLVSELAFTYSYKFDDKRSVFVYAGLPGEPALGPVMFMHRTSGANNPDAPISHHWQDATHITWGVITAGVSFGKVKLEASAFNGTEPDENRWAFDRPRLNSFSGRLSWNPTRDLSFQVSHGYLRNPEPLEPDLKILRKTTASAIYNRPFGKDKNWASTFVWGQNYGNGERSNAFLFESNFDFAKNAVFGRVERVEKSAHELVLDHSYHGPMYWVGAYSVGYVRDIYSQKGIDVGLGGMLTANSNPASLIPVYGGTRHGGWQIFLRIRPSKVM